MARLAGLAVGTTLALVCGGAFLWALAADRGSEHLGDDTPVWLT